MSGISDDRPPIPVAVINFFPAFTPPGSGGEMRYGCLYERLSRLGFRVRMVNPTYPFVEPETVEHNPRWTEYRIPQTMLHHRLYQIMRRGLGQGECSAAVVSLAARFHGAFLERAREAIQASRIVIFDYPMPLGPFFKGLRGPRPLLVHNAYNVEGLMQRDTLRGPQGRLIASWTDRVQRALCRKADVVFACGREDAAIMAERFKMDPTKIYIVPNGVDTEEIAPVSLDDEEATTAARKTLGLEAAAPCALFLGSHHPPNIEAARFLMERVAPECPGVQFVIAGSVCEHLEGSPPEHVRLFGKFENYQKGALLQAATVAVNPMFSGSGSNLKMLEFFGAGLPVLTTPVGARGLFPERDAPPYFQMADAAGFAAQLQDLVAHSEKRRELGGAARRAAIERYSWDRIAGDAAEILHHKIAPRVLVLNDYPVSPVTFGGKVRLFQHYKMVARDLPVTILTETPEGYRRGALAPHLEEINIPESRLKHFVKQMFFALVGTPGDDLAAYLTVRWNRAMRRAFERESRFARCVVLSHPYMVPLIRKSLRLPVVYESHNVESLLKPQLYGAGFWADRAARLVRRCEEAAVRRAAVLTACSQEDGNRLLSLCSLKTGGGSLSSPRFVLAINGVDCAAHERDCLGMPRAALKKAAGLEEEPVAVFLGSGHPPNTDAARFILEELAPRHPGVLFLIAGSVCYTVQNLAGRANMLLFYEVGDTLKNRLLGLADIALNPLMTGSGVSLKIMDYLASGAAVLSTDIGARGVAITHGVNGMLCPLDRFSAALAELAGDLDACHALGERGRALARERYDWGATSRDFREAVGGLPEDLAPPGNDTP